MKKVLKVIFIIIIYVFIFYGIIKGVQYLLDNNKIKEEPKEEIKEEPKEEIKEEPKEEIKEEPKEEKQVVKQQTKSTPTKSDYQAYASDLVFNTYSWTEEDYYALVKLWTKESDWNPNSHNKSSGAHGIPQSLPANKMASEGDDYYTNGYTQIRWGLKYIKQRYGTPLKAWQHFQNKNWY